MPENKDLSLDVAGLGRIAEAIPDESWNRAVKLATDTTAQLLAPITATTSGIGRLIAGTFDDLAEWRKISFAGILEDAAAKVKAFKQRSSNTNPRALVAIIEESSTAIDKEMRALWGNLLARELTVGGTHPEMPRTLSRLTRREAELLLRLKRHPQSIEIDPTDDHVGVAGEELSAAMAQKPNAAAYFILQSAGLIALYLTDWHVTPFGDEFLKAVSAPPSKASANARPRRTKGGRDKQA